MLWLQTDLIRKENSEDMSIGRAISMVFERRPDLRSYLLLFFQNIDHLFPNQLKRKKENNFSLRVTVNTGWTALVIRCCSGTYAEWKAGLLRMQIPYHSSVGTRLISFWLFFFIAYLLENAYMLFDYCLPETFGLFLGLTIVYTWKNSLFKKRISFCLSCYQMGCVICLA